MFKLLRGNPEDLEGKAIIYVTGFEGLPLQHKEHGQFFPGLEVVIKKLNGDYEQKKERMIVPSPINNLDPQFNNHDIIQGPPTFNMEQGFVTLGAISTVYFSTFLSQIETLKAKTKAYGAKYDLPERLTSEELKQAILGVSSKLNHFLNFHRIPKITIKDLEVLVRNTPLRSTVKSLKYLLAQLNGDEDLVIKELVDLYIKQIQYVAQESFEEAQKTHDEIIKKTKS